MWTSICVLERRAKRNSTICSLVCSKTTARRLPGWVRPVPTGHDYSLRQPRSEGFLFWWQPLNLLSDVGDIPSLPYAPRKQSQDGIQAKAKSVWTKIIQERRRATTGSLCFTQMKTVCQRWRKMWRVSLLLYKQDRNRPPFHSNQPLNQHRLVRRKERAVWTEVT